MKNRAQAAFADSKPHYQLLDGLRGVAALLVLWYHVHEGFAFAGSVNGVGDGRISSFNHGYLAVDFFFILSGFVIGYAYEDRWPKGFRIADFFKRRLIRLHPMVVLGAVIGVCCFMLQGNVQWNGTAVSLPHLALAFLSTLLFIPALKGSSNEIRGNAEMFPLNGPYWSLFFEYLGNFLYALFIRKLSTRKLAILVVIEAIALSVYALNDVSGYGSIDAGWTLDIVNFTGGLLRMLFPFSLGIWMSRIFKPISIKGTFPICSALLFVLFSVPYLQNQGTFHPNGLFELVCILLIFPAIVWLGASGTSTDKVSKAISGFLGEISFPLYVVHYPVMYLFYSWLIKNKLYSFENTFVMSLSVMAINIALAYVALKLYDKPLRNYLSKKFLK